MTRTVLFDPLLPWPVLLAIAVAMGLLLGFAAVRRLRGWPLRSLSALVLLIALANPALQTEDREPLSDIVLIAVDETASQGLGPRRAQTEAALEDVLEQLDSRGIEYRITRVTDPRGAEADAGTLLVSALQTLLSETPRARIAGTLILSNSDGAATAWRGTSQSLRQIVDLSLGGPETRMARSQVSSITSSSTSVKLISTEMFG